MTSVRAPLPSVLHTVSAAAPTHVPRRQVTLPTPPTARIDQGATPQVVAGNNLTITTNTRICHFANCNITLVLHDCGGVVGTVTTGQASLVVSTGPVRDGRPYHVRVGNSPVSCR